MCDHLTRGLHSALLPAGSVIHFVSLSRRSAPWTAGCGHGHKVPPGAGPQALAGGGGVLGEFEKCFCFFGTHHRHTIIQSIPSLELQII